MATSRAFELSQLADLLDVSNSVPTISGLAAVPDSIAIENETIAANAFGANSIAIGANALAETSSSIVIGNTSIANGTGPSISIGQGAISNGVYAIAIGATQTRADQIGATAVGSQAKALAVSSTALGRNANATGNYALAVGLATGSGANCVAIGLAAVAAEDASIALGYSASANGSNSVSIGSYSSVDGNNSVAIGPGATTSNDNEIILGTDQNVIMFANVSIAATPNTDTFGLYVDGDIYSTNNLIAASDLRLKENVNTLENVLSSLDNIRGVSYNFIGNEENNIGVIAQEVQTVYPELVHGKDSLGVNYNGLIGVLIQAVKELKDEVEELKNERN